MKNLSFRLILAASATALVSACASIGVPGFGDASGGCRTVYVVTGGGVQPISNCGGLPRDTLMAKTMSPLQLETEGQPADPSAPEQPVATPASAAAKATAPYDPVTKPYPGPAEMLENADMAAFMTRVRDDFARKTNAGAWGYVIVDAIAADDVATAQTVLDAMTGRPSNEMLSAGHLRPWVLAFAGRGADAQAEMMRARRILPPVTLTGHRALLAEGLGDTALALSIYAEVSTEFDTPSPEDQEDPDYFARLMAYGSQRVLAVRHAELLRSLNRDQEAIAMLTVLLAASPDDAYVEKRLELAKAGKDRRPVRTLKQAMAQAIADEGSVVQQRQSLVDMMTTRGGKPPFNHLLSSIRQSALLLDPDNGEVRVAEVSDLFTHGKFEPTLRIAQIGKPSPDQLAALLSTAARAALQLGSSDALEAMTEQALRIDPSPEAKLEAAGALTAGGKTDRAVQLIDQAVAQGGLLKQQRVYAMMARGQAQLQAGNVAGAVQAARDARALEDDQTTKLFLASMLVESPQRADGLVMMREMMTGQPTDTGLMNNLGYSLIDNHASLEELDEGFKLLKQAIRMTPDEPNLLDSIGWAYYQYGDFREANRFIQMALDAFAPFGQWELSDHMGDVQWRLGDQDKARAAWRESLKAFPPAHNRAAIEAKIRGGLTTAAPQKRDTPEVPLNRDRDGVSDI